MQKMKGLFSIGDVLNNYLSRAGLSQKLSEQKAVINWAAIVGPELADATTAVRVRDHRLVVKVNSPILRNELTYLKPEIIKKLKRELPESGVEDVEFR